MSLRMKKKPLAISSKPFNQQMRRGPYSLNWRTTAKRQASIHKPSLETRIQENIQQITQKCGQYVHGLWATYERLDDDTLFTIGHWHTPTDFQTRRPAEGTAPADILTRKKQAHLLIRNVGQTGYADTDPIIRKYHLVTFYGLAVQTRDTWVGCLSLVFQGDFVPTKTEQQVLERYVAALQTEEELRACIRTQQQAHERHKDKTRDSPQDPIWPLSIHEPQGIQSDYFDQLKNTHVLNAFTTSNH